MKMVLKKNIFCLLVLSLGIAIYAEDGYAVIANKDNSETSIDKTTLKRIFKGQIEKFGNEKAVPINLPYEEVIARKFLEEVVGMSPTKFKKYWVDQMIKGEGTAPMIQKTSAMVKTMVSSVPGAIGYIPEGDLDDTVKKIDLK